MAILSDSASKMSSAKSGLQVRVREIPLQLIDIDDACCHMNSFLKYFTKGFNSRPERLYKEMSRNFKVSKNLVGYLKEICLLSGIT